jgi:hypothetical protein
VSNHHGNTSQYHPCHSHCTVILLWKNTVPDHLAYKSQCANLSGMHMNVKSEHIVTHVAARRENR